MTIPIKSFCEFSSKESEKYKKEIKKLVKKPKFVCKKCLRASSDKNYLCKPTKI